MTKVARYLSLLLILCCSLPLAAQNYVTITASNIKDAGGFPLTYGQINFLPTNGKGQIESFVLPASGQAINRPVRCYVVAGAITTSDRGGPCQLANTQLTTPANVCYQVTITDTTGKQVQGPGYGCFQPTAANANFDNFQPNQTGIIEAYIGPVGNPGLTGPAGPQGPTGPQGPQGASGIPAAQVSALFQATNSQQRNIFDSTRAVSGVLVTAATGVTTSFGAPWYSTGFMAVTGGASYVTNATIQAGLGASGVAFYDAGDTYISGTVGPISPGTAIVAPSTAYYMRFAFNSTTNPLSTIMVTQGTGGIPAYNDFTPIGAIAAGTIASSDVASGLAASHNYLAAQGSAWTGNSLNLYTNTGVSGILTAACGLSEVNNGFSTTGLMPVYGLGSVITNVVTVFGGTQGYWCFYDVNKNVISSALGVSANTPVTIPIGAYYANFGFGGGGTFAVDLPNFVANVVVMPGSTALPAGMILNSETGSLTTAGTPLPGTSLAAASALNAEIAARTSSVLIPTHWKGQRLCTIGDSFDFYGSNASRGGGFQYAIANQLGMTLTIDNGVVGEMLKDVFTAPNFTSVTNSTTIQNCDLEVVELSTNDYGSNNPDAVGTINDTGSTSPATYYGSIQNLITTFLSWKPTLKIIFITDWYRGTDATHPAAPPANPGGNVPEDYANALLTMCPKYGIPVIDVYHKSGVNSLNVEQVTFDGFLHPSAIGYTNFYNPLVVGEIAKY